MKHSRRFTLGLATGSLAATATGLARADLDTAVSTAISGAAANPVAALGLMTVVAATIWAGRQVFRLFGR